MALKIYYSDHLEIPLPPGHRFPADKYRMLREKLIADNILAADNLLQSPPASRADLLRAHDPAYVDAVVKNGLSAQELRRIGLPWSPAFVRRVTATAGGAIASVEQAIANGVSGQLAGGTHHAHRNFGSGYCVFNDFAVAALTALEKGWVRRIAIIDLDVHQGDGNAAILGGDERVMVLSLHGEKNFPFRKISSDIDVALPDGMGDADYLAALEAALPKVLDFHPCLALYQAGVDPLKEDRLGRLALTHEGLMARDRMVLEACKRREIPVSLGLGGGYADPIDLSVKAYVNTYRVVRELFGP